MKKKTTLRIQATIDDKSITINQAVDFCAKTWFNEDYSDIQLSAWNQPRPSDFVLIFNISNLKPEYRKYVTSTGNNWSMINSVASYCRIIGIILE